MLGREYKLLSSYVPWKEYSLLSGRKSRRLSESLLDSQRDQISKRIYVREERYPENRGKRMESSTSLLNELRIVIHRITLILSIQHVSDSYP